MSFPSLAASAIRRHVAGEFIGSDLSPGEIRIAVATVAMGAVLAGFAWKGLIETLNAGGTGHDGPTR